MVIDKTDLSEFARFLREQYHAKPIVRTGDDGELLRAVIGCHLIMVLDFNTASADVWCSDEPWLAEIWSQWTAFQELTKCS